MAAEEKEQERVVVEAETIKKIEIQKEELESTRMATRDTHE